MIILCGNLIIVKLKWVAILVVHHRAVSGCNIPGLRQLSHGTKYFLLENRRCFRGGLQSSFGEPRTRTIDDLGLGLKFLKAIYGLL